MPEKQVAISKLDYFFLVWNRAGILEAGQWRKKAVLEMTSPTFVTGIVFIALGVIGILAFEETRLICAGVVVVFLLMQGFSALLRFLFAASHALYCDQLNKVQELEKAIPKPSRGGAPSGARAQTGLR